jgi:hypothetical protein
MSARRQITHEAWRAIGRELYGPRARHWAFKCVACGHVQTAAGIAERCNVDLERAAAGVYVSCEGRLGGAGCDWTLGGLFRTHTLEVLDPETQVFTPVFEFADPRADAMVEAVKLARRAHPTSDAERWMTYAWPEWIPVDVRAHIWRFFDGARGWLAAAQERDVPPLGTRVTFRPDGQVVEGRFVYVANDSGYVVSDDGTAVRVSL